MRKAALGVALGAWSVTGAAAMQEAVPPPGKAATDTGMSAPGRACPLPTGTSCESVAARKGARRAPAAS